VSGALRSEEKVIRDGCNETTTQPPTWSWKYLQTTWISSIKQTALLLAPLSRSCLGGYQVSDAHWILSETIGTVCEVPTGTYVHTVLSPKGHHDNERREYIVLGSTLWNNSRVNLDWSGPAIIDNPEHRKPTAVADYQEHGTGWKEDPKQGTRITCPSVVQP